MKQRLIAVYYFRNGQLDWETHLKLYLGGWKAHPTVYISKKKNKNTTPKQVLKNAIQQWKKVTGIDPSIDGHFFSVMILKTKDMYVSLKTVSGIEIEEYLK